MRTAVTEDLVPGQAEEEVEEAEEGHRSREKMVGLCHLMTKTWPTYRVGISI